MNNRIADVRNSRDYTQKELAERVGCSRETVANIERGKYNVSLILADRICNALECHLYELFPELESFERYQSEIAEQKEQTRTATLEGIAKLADTFK